MVDSSFLTPLNGITRIVDPHGRPTDYFMRYIQDRGGALTDLDATITVLGDRVTVVEVDIAEIQAIDIVSADGTVTVTNGSLGNGGLDIDLEVEEQAVLDKISTTQGVVLYRGASDWEVLAPGTSGHYLKTLGAGADPAWAAVSSGGSFRGALAYYGSDATAQNITTGPDLSFDTESYDTDAIHDTSTNPQRMTVPAGVTKVRLAAGCQVALATSNTEAQLVIRKNGSAAFAGGAQQRSERGATTWAANVSTSVVDVTAGDYFTVAAYNETDTSVTIEASRTWFSMEIIE